jgi:uncharacterized membrane protein YhaH (DUF805 family)
MKQCLKPDLQQILGIPQTLKLDLGDMKTFVPKFPPDFNIANTQESILQFLSASGKIGRSAYFFFLLVDSLLIVCYFTLNRQLFSKFKNQSPEVTFIQHYLGIIGVIGDCYENICFASMMYLFGNNQSITSEFVERAQIGTTVKFAMLFVVIGLQISSLLQFVVYPYVIQYLGMEEKRGGI